MPLISAGILLYRFNADKEAEVFLVHPGGPFFSKKDKGWWGIPKGLPAENEDLLDVAKREFHEETGYKPKGEFIDIGTIKQKGGKTVHAWAVEDDLPQNWELKCNTFTIEWPPKSGSFKDFPEIDKAKFFSLQEAREYVLPAQSEFLDKLNELIQPKG